MEPVLRVHNITKRFGTNVANDHITFDLYPGEIHSLLGENGAGKSTLMNVIYGVYGADEGEIYLNGKRVDITSPKQAIDLGIALVPEDRKRYGALLGVSIKNNINMPIYERISKASVIDLGTEKKTAEKYREEIQIKCPSINQMVKNLSGGNQQKVILGKWLAADSQLIIFDEPTRGIDVGAKYEIYKLINALVEEGRAVLMISS